MFQLPLFNSLPPKDIAESMYFGVSPPSPAMCYIVPDISTSNCAYISIHTATINVVVVVIQTFIPLSIASYVSIIRFKAEDHRRVKSI